MSGSTSKEHCMEFIRSSRLAIRSSMMSWRLFTSERISYTLFWVWNNQRKKRKEIISFVNHHPIEKSLFYITFAISVIVLALSISFLWSIFTLRKLEWEQGKQTHLNINSNNPISLRRRHPWLSITFQIKIFPSLLFVKSYTVLASFLWSKATKP